MEPKSYKSKVLLGAIGVLGIVLTCYTIFSRPSEKQIAAALARASKAGVPLPFTGVQEFYQDSAYGRGYRAFFKINLTSQEFVSLRSHLDSNQIPYALTELNRCGGKDLAWWNSVVPAKAYFFGITKKPPIEILNAYCIDRGTNIVLLLEHSVDE